VRPFLFVLAPLLIALGAYYVYWRGQADIAASAVEAQLGTRPQMSGFPYRIAASLPAASLSRGGDALALALNAGHTEIDRGPLNGSLFVGTFTDLRGDLSAPGLIPDMLAVTAPRAAGSLRVSAGQVARLSMIAETASLTSSLWDGPLRMTDAQLHLRETPNASPAAGPTAPGQAEARLAGTAHFGSGAVVALSLPIRVTADAPLTSMAGWRDGGTVEVEDGTLSGADGAAFAGVEATLAPLPGGALALAGTLTTDCPKTAQWLLGGGAHPGAEYRRRRPAEFALSGTLSAPMLRERPTPSGGLARSQEPPCPDLRQ
jgi:hypothetical protein